jgi:hypothetical protein
MKPRLKKQNAGKPLASRLTPRELVRILRRITVDASSGCWLWTGHTDRHGYGQVKLRGRAHWVHRVMVQAFRGQFPDARDANNKKECLNPSCCNPDHLEPLTRSENGRDGARRQWGKDSTEVEEVLY